MVYSLGYTHRNSYQKVINVQVQTENSFVNYLISKQVLYIITRHKHNTIKKMNGVCSNEKGSHFAK